MSLFALPPQLPEQPVQSAVLNHPEPIQLAQAIAPNGDGSSLDVQGNQININGGTEAGNNLFHSFERFGLNAAQTANFIANPTIENILGRINGGQASLIDGQLQITGADANLFLLNPAGMVFGPNARLNLPGAFTASTSDHLSFSNQFFNVFGNNDYSQLLGNPDGFIFSTADPAGILNQGNLSLTPGQQLNLIGGSVTSSGSLAAPDGQVNVIAAPGNSTVRLGQDGATLSIAANAVAAPDNLPPSFSPEAMPELSAGNVTLQQLEAQGAIVSANGDVVLQGSELNTSGDLAIVAGDRLTIRDSDGNPFIAKAGGNLTLQGSNSLDILALSNLQTLIQSGGNLRLISDNAISADAHFTSGGDFRLTNAEGNTNAFISLYDPIIRAAGNVTFGDYLGPALKIEATGSITTGNITITAPDMSILLTGDPDFTELTTLPSLILRAGTTLSGGPDSLPTNISGTTVSSNSPADTPASIIAGNIDTSLSTIAGGGFPTNAGNITLTAPGDITAGLLDSFILNNLSTSDNLNAGDVTVTAGGSVGITGINSSVSSGTSLGNYQAGQVNLSAGNGLTLGNVNSSVSGADSLVQTAGNIDIVVTGNAVLGQLNASGESTDALGLQAGNIGINVTGNLQFDSANATATGFEISPSTFTGDGGSVSISAIGTVQGTGLIPGSPSTIDTTGTNSSGSIELTHDGGPDNVAFQTGNASLNGVAGTLAAGGVTSSGESFGNAGVESRGPGNEINLTFNNTAPSLSGSGNLETTVDQPVTIAIADLNLATADANNDNFSLEIAAIANGTLSRNGTPLAPGDSIALTDTLSYTPASGATGSQTAFELLASDGISTSASLQIPVNINEVLPPEPPVEPEQPIDPPRPETRNPIIPDNSSYLIREARVLEQPVVYTLPETRLLGMPLTQAPAISELSVLRGVVPEAPLLMLPVRTWNIARASGLSNGTMGPAGITGELQLQNEAVALAAAGVHGAAIAGLEAGSLAGEPSIPLSGTADSFGFDPSGFVDVDGNPINPESGFETATITRTPISSDAGTTPAVDLPLGIQADPFDPGGIDDLAGSGEAVTISAPFDPSGPGSFDSPAPGPPPTPSTPNPSGSSVPANTPEPGPAPGPSPTGTATPGNPSSPSGSASPGPIATATDQPGPSGGGTTSAGSSSEGGSPGNPESSNTDSGSPGSTSTATGGVQNCPQQVAQVHQQTKANKQKKEGLYKALINCFEQNLEVAEASDDQNLQLYALNNLGSSYFVVGDYLKALDAHQQQLTAAKLTGDATQIGIALSGIGAAHAALGDYDEAIAQYQRSLNQLPNDKALQWRGLTLRNLGNAYLSKKDYNKALQYQNQSLQLSQSIKDRYGEMQALGNLGNAYTLNGEFDTAIAAYEPSLALSRELGARLDEAQTLLGLGTTSSYQKQYEDAIAYNNQSLKLLTQLDNRLGQGIVLTNLGDAHYQLQQFAPAETNFRQSIEVWESLRAGLGTNDAYKVSIFETQRAAYRNLQELLAEQNRVGESLEVAEQSRGRAFVELLARGNATAQADAANVAPPNLAELQRIAREQNATLVEYSLAHEQFVETPHGASVQYASEPQDSKIIIWTVQPSGQVDLRQVDLRAQQDMPSLKRLVQVARRCMNDSSCVRRVERNTRFGFVEPEPVESAISEAETQEIAANNPLYQLHQLLIEPIADLLPQSEEEKVIFVPQDHLFLVPFPALQASNGSYLIDRHTVMTSPSIQLLAATKARGDQLGNGNNSALIVGNPAPMPGSFSPLPFTEDEASTVGGLLGGNAIIGSDATEAIVKQLLPQAGTIHLATHGIFNAAKPLEGAIALAPEGGEDGLLTAGEILQSRLQARLVVLSACDTGRGRITGDGVIGLSRSFLAAGASSVMVSLWQVPDDATSVLMTEFHRNRQGSKDNAQALRQAMLTVKESYGDPLAWSGFTLVGES